MPSGVYDRNKKLSDEERKAIEKEYQNIYQKNYRKKPEVKEREKKRKQTPKYKKNAKDWAKKPEVKERRLQTYSDNRLQILKYYSKELSKSDTPCCLCCGQNSHTDFLDIDHIIGKKEMESNSELMAIGYSSEFDAAQLFYWIIKNNFPKGFQILCKNCNQAKGMLRNNNECPMKGKKH